MIGIGLHAISCVQVIKVIHWQGGTHEHLEVGQLGGGDISKEVCFVEEAMPLYRRETYFD